MDLPRFVQIYIIQLGVGGIYYLLLAFLILRRSTKPLNKIFSMFFISVALGTIINVVYASISISGLEFIVQFLHILTFYLFTLAQVFLLLFNLIILKSESIIDRKKQVIMVLGYAVLLLILFVVGFMGGVKIDSNTEWKPVWDLTFFLVTMIVFVPSLILPIIYTSLEIYTKFQDQQLKKKWRYFLIGVLLYFLMWIGTSVSNFLAEETVRSIWAIIALISLLTTYTMYYGVGRQIE